MCEMVEIVTDFKADLLASMRAGAGENKIASIGFNATQALLEREPKLDGIHDAVIEVGTKTNMAMKAIKA